MSDERKTDSSETRCVGFTGNPVCGIHRKPGVPISFLLLETDLLLAVGTYLK